MAEIIDKNWKECAKRRPIPKAIRELVYKKYNGHCAYCGKELKIGEMQIDHIIPIMKSYYEVKNEALKIRQMIQDGSFNEINNLMPACRACNFYKSMNNIEGLRKRILTELEHTCRSTFQTRLAMLGRPSCYYTILFAPFLIQEPEKEGDPLVYEFSVACELFVDYCPGL